MSNNPTPSPAFAGPQQAFEHILSTIIATNSFIRVAKVRPHLLAFISHPIIKELIADGDAPTPPVDAPSPNLDLQKIQDSLMQLSKAVEALKKAPPSNSNKDNNASKNKQKLSDPQKLVF